MASISRSFGSDRNSPTKLFIVIFRNVEGTYFLGILNLNIQFEVVQNFQEVLPQLSNITDPLPDRFLVMDQALP